jgi:hypothetical protein
LHLPKQTYKANEKAMTQKLSMDLNELLLELTHQVARVANALEPKPQRKLGVGVDQRAIHIDCARETLSIEGKDTLVDWYVYDYEEKQKKPVGGGHIVGYIQGVETYLKDEKEKLKLLFSDGENRYELVSGLYPNNQGENVYNPWSGNLLVLLEALTEEQVKNPINIFPKNLDREKNATSKYSKNIVMAGLKVPHGGAYITPERQPKSLRRGDHEAIIQRINDIVGHVTAPARTSEAQQPGQMAKPLPDGTKRLIDAMVRLGVEKSKYAKTAADYLPEGKTSAQCTDDEIDAAIAKMDEELAAF